jgi:hypothetical protein
MAGEDDGLFGGNVDEELQRWIPVLLFHIPVFSISFTVCIFVVLVLLLCTFFFFFPSNIIFLVYLYVYTTYLSAYSHVNRILFVVTLE